MSTLEVASTFSGVGGIDLGFQSAGIPTRLLCEYDKHAQSVLARRFPGVPIHPDVTELTADDLANAGLVPERTILAGGFPCQDLSVAGARRGMGEGTRSGLYWHLDRLMAEFRPAWVVFENVPGLLSSNGGRDMGAVLGSLADRGYGFAYRVLDAQFFGVPQRRRRVIIVGRLGDSGAAPAQVLLEPEGSRGDSASGHPSGAGVADPAERRAVEAGGDVAPTLTARYGKGADSTATIPLAVVNSLTAANGGPDDNMAQAGHLVVETFQKTTRPATSEHPDVWEHRDVAATLSPFDLGSETRAVELVVSVEAESGADLVRNCVGGVLSGVNLDEVGQVADSGGAERDGFHDSNLAAELQADLASSGSQIGNDPVTTLGDHTHSLTAEGHDASEDGTGRGTPIIAATLTAGTSAPNVSAPGRRQEDDHNLVAESQTVVRRLTPLECERLQGHPDNWTEGQSDAQRYKQMGNGVAVPVFAWVAHRLAAIDKEAAA